MDQLTINISGEIQSSNFDEWKKELIAQIHSTNIKLATDEDFVAAARHVKLFKTAEHSLKEAKQSAINQATEINKLFSGIDEISEQARQARLILERQIKARKLEIKEGLIQIGVENVYEFIKQQPADFSLINHENYIDHSRFNSAVRGKAGINGMEIAIDRICTEIKLEISQKSDEITTNGMTLDSLSNNYKILFQDRSFLIALTKQELDLTIEKRIALFNEENTRIKAEKVINELKHIENVELNPDTLLNPESSDIIKKDKYSLIIEILSSKDNAIEIARSIRQAYSENELITSIRLTRLHDKL